MFVNSSLFKVLSLIFIVWAGLFYASIASAVSIWYRSETFAHCFLILPICLFLINQKWDKLNQILPEPNFKILVFIVPTLALWVFGSLAQLLVIEQGAAFLALPLMLWAVLGNQIARVLAFVMGFWILSVPVGEFLVPQLQELTADITVWAIQLTGIPVYREGLYIAIPGGLFEVAVACSGIRYLIASFTLGSLYAYLNYSSTKKRLIFVLFSILLPLIANGIRAYGIVMIAHLSDMKYATGVDHLIYGWLFFGVVILIMFSIGNIWADPIEPKDKSRKAALASYPIARFSVALAIVSATILASLGYKSAVENPQSERLFVAEDVISIDSPVREQSWLPDFKNATVVASGSSQGVDYYLAYYKANVQDSELINSVNSMFNTDNWSIVWSQDTGRYRTLQISNAGGAKRQLSYTYVTDWIVSPSAIKIKLSQAIQAFMGQPQEGLVIVMSVPLDNAGVREKLLERKASQKLTEQLMTHFADE